MRAAFFFYFICLIQLSSLSFGAALLAKNYYYLLPPSPLLVGRITLPREPSNLYLRLWNAPQRLVLRQGTAVPTLVPSWFSCRHLCGCCFFRPNHPLAHHYPLPSLLLVVFRTARQLLDPEPGPGLGLAWIRIWIWISTWIRTRDLLPIPAT